MSQQTIIRGAKTLQVAPIPQSPLYSATLSNRNRPGHSRYLRGVLYAFRDSVGPVGDQAASEKSRRNLACIRTELADTSRSRRDRVPAPRPPRGVTSWRRAQSNPRRYPERPGWLGGDDLSENGSVCHMGLPSPFWGSFARGRRARRSVAGPTLTRHFEISGWC